MEELSKKHIHTIKDAAHKLTGAKRRAFEAQVTLDYLGGSARRAEMVFGWYRETVELGLNELRTGIECLANFAARGRDKSEEKLPQLKEDIRSLVEPESHTDPKFQTPFKYTRITAKGLRQALMDKKGWKDLIATARPDLKSRRQLKRNAFSVSIITGWAPKAAHSLPNSMILLFGYHFKSIFYVDNITDSSISKPNLIN